MPLARPEPPDTRVIAHVDLDCFYVQVEQRRNPELKGKPTAVVQYNPFRGGAIIAVGYEARHSGVTRIMRGDDARKICPDINLVQVPVAHGKADLTVYRDAGSEVVEIFSRMGICERASIDEVYLDITEAAAKRLVQSPPDVRDDYSEEVLRTRIVGLVEDPAGVNVREWLSRSFASRSDQLLTCGAIIVAELRAAVVKETQFTTSAGIAHNKMLAKLASGMHKPAQQTLIPSSGVQTLLANLPAKKIKHLGGKLGRSLERDLGVKTMGDLLPYTEAKLQDLYGFNTGTWLWRVARGMNGDEVEGRTLPKSHGCGKTFPGPTALNNLDSIRYWLTELSAELQERLDEDLQLNNRKACLLVVHASCHIVGKASNSRKPFSSKSCPLRYGKEKIASDAVQLFKRSLSEFCPDLPKLSPLKGETTGTSCTWAVTALSVGANNIYVVPAGMGTITRFFGSPATSSAKEKAMGTAVSSVSPSLVSDVSCQAGALSHEKSRLSLQNEEEVISLNEPDEKILISADSSSSHSDTGATFEVEEPNVGSLREGDADEEAYSGESELPASPNAYSVLSRREGLAWTHKRGSHSQQQLDRCSPYALVDRPSPSVQSHTLSCKPVKRNLMDVLKPSAWGHKNLECTRKCGEIGYCSQSLSATEVPDLAPDCHQKESLVDCSMGRNPVEVPENLVGILDLKDKAEVILCSPLELRPVEKLAGGSGIGQGPGYLTSMMSMHHTISDGSELTHGNIKLAAAAEELVPENPASVQLPTSSVEPSVPQGPLFKPQQDTSNQARHGESSIHVPEEYALQDTGTVNSVLHQTTSERSDRPASREHSSICSNRTALLAFIQSAGSLKIPISDNNGSLPPYPESSIDQDGRHSVNRDEVSSGLSKRSVITRVDELWEKWKSTSEKSVTSNKSLDKGSAGRMFQPDESYTTALGASPQDIKCEMQGHNGPIKRKKASSISDFFIRSPDKAN